MHAEEYSHEDKKFMAGKLEPISSRTLVSSTSQGEGLPPCEEMCWQCDHAWWFTFLLIATWRAFPQRGYGQCSLDLWLSIRCTNLALLLCWKKMISRWIIHEQAGRELANESLLTNWWMLWVSCCECLLGCNRVPFLSCTFNNVNTQSQKAAIMLLPATYY